MGRGEIFRVKRSGAKYQSSWIKRVHWKLKGNRTVLKSNFSRMVIQDEKDRRALYFVKDSGRNVLESAMDRKDPDHLKLLYSRAMFATHLFHPAPETSLLVGLGGGSMPRFIQSRIPEMWLDIVEIDPAIEMVARQYFFWSPAPKTRLFITDAEEFMVGQKERYDVIYMDAYLKPATETDSLGVPLGLKTRRFRKDLRDSLRKNGIIAFNLNRSEHLEEDLDIYSEGYAGRVLLNVPSRENRVLLVFRDGPVPDLELVRSRARRLDLTGFAHFSMEEIVDWIEEI